MIYDITLQDLKNKLFFSFPINSNNIHSFILFYKSFSNERVQIFEKTFEQGIYYFLLPLFSAIIKKFSHIFNAVTSFECVFIAARRDLVKNAF